MKLKMLLFQFTFVLLGSLMTSTSSAVPTTIVQRDNAASFPELSFIDSCDRHSTVVKYFPETRKYFLRSTCQDNIDVPRCSKIDLDNCLANFGGQLSAQPNGGFSGSCHDCRFSNNDSPKKAEFKCICGSGSGFTETLIQLDPYIANSDGRLSCFDIKATGCYD